MPTRAKGKLLINADIVPSTRRTIRIVAAVTSKAPPVTDANNIPKTVARKPNIRLEARPFMPLRGEQGTPALSHVGRRRKRPADRATRAVFSAWGRILRPAPMGTRRLSVLLRKILRPMPTSAPGPRLGTAPTEPLLGQLRGTLTVGISMQTFYI